MQVGSFRTYVEIEQKTEIGRDAQNQPMTRWTLFRACWAEAVATRSAERMAADFQRFQSTLYRFRTRYSETNGVDGTMRLTVGGKLYDIRGVLPDEIRHEDIMIEATLQKPKV